jgi:hypothetical protein
MIPRTLSAVIGDRLREYPILAITGPRQSGKTTLSRASFPDRPYVSLEELDQRQFALQDPRGFLAGFPDGAVLDEVQRTPDLFSYLQTLVDTSGKMGQFILTGSHRFGLLTGVSQSLAARAAMLSLLPFSLGELRSAGMAPGELNQLLFGGRVPDSPGQALPHELQQAIGEDCQTVLCGHRFGLPTPRDREGRPIEYASASGCHFRDMRRRRVTEGAGSQREGFEHVLLARPLREGGGFHSRHPSGLLTGGGQVGSIAGL